MRALLKPKVQRPGVEAFPVTLLARTGNQKIKVQGLNPHAPVFAAERWRLFDEVDRRRRITEDEFNRLPWAGAGKDPAHTESADFFASLEVKP